MEKIQLKNVVQFKIEQHQIKEQGWTRLTQIACKRQI